MSPQSAIVALDKPAGVSSHSPSERGLQAGFKEALEIRTAKKFWLGHRLDKETSGLLLACSDAQTAADLGRVFDRTSRPNADAEPREIFEKVYFFATQPKRSSQNESLRQIVVSSHIAKGRTGRGATSRYYSISPTAREPVNAVTHFELVTKLDGGLEIWQAQPLTGKPHQIRLHAESFGRAVLGDREHNGAEFPFLCLFAKSIRWGDQIWSAPEPRWLENPETLLDLRLSQWLWAIDRRERWFRSLEKVIPDFLRPSAMRWIDQDGGLLRMDQLGDVVHFHWYGNSEEAVKPDRATLSLLAQSINRLDWFAQMRPNRGSGLDSDQTEVLTETCRPDLPPEFEIEENSMRFKLKIPQLSQGGHSVGLFLDQRENRKWVRAGASGRSVLNLFAYTGGFTVAAAQGGATKVVSVDLSKSYLKWSESNLELNSLNGSQITSASPSSSSCQFEFRAMDAFRYLDWCEKNHVLFDLIICDPPSFARVPGSPVPVFRIEKNGVDLWLKVLGRLNPDSGEALLSCNSESITYQDFLNQIAVAITRTKGRAFQTVTAPPVSGDFGLPGETAQMKSVIVKALPTKR